MSSLVIAPHPRSDMMKSMVANRILELNLLPGRLPNYRSPAIMHPERDVMIYFTQDKYKTGLWFQNIYVFSEMHPLEAFFEYQDNLHPSLDPQEHIYVLEHFTKRLVDKMLEEWR